MKGFRVIYRNYGHWDIAQGEGRIFRIRGGPGKYVVIDERSDDVRKKDWQEFNTLQMAMSYITDILMYQLIVAEGQEPIIIEDWNV